MPLPAHATPSAAAKPHPPLAGTWAGELITADTSRRVIVHFTLRQDGRWGGTLDSPEQGRTALPVTVLPLPNGIRVHCPALHGVYSGNFAPGGKTIVGHWAEKSVRIPLNLLRADPPAAP
ncbi:MAG: hypothetical protein H7338_14080 [Candidatus Sericytochromatia bacterium]|nr:hypothetical protein [Candidatus Sericytochromatia bacterium]